MTAIKKYLVILALTLVLGLSGISIAQAVGSTVVVHLIGSNNNPLSGVKIYAVNGTSQLGVATTNSSGYAVLTPSTDGLMLIVSSGPIGWVAINTTSADSINLWLNSTDLHPVNITVIMGDTVGRISFNATFYANETSSKEEVIGTLTGLSAPVFVYPSKTDNCSKMRMYIPATVTKLFVTYTLSNVTVHESDGHVIVFNYTDFVVDSTMDTVEIRYYTTTPLYLGLPLQTWVIIGLIAIMSGILVVMAKSRKAALAVIKHYSPKRRVIHDYEIMNGYNGFFEAIDSSPIEEKEKVARRILKRLS